MSGIHETRRHQNYTFASILSKMMSIYSLTLHKMKVILDFTHNAMSKVISGHTIMSGIHENHMVDTKIMNLLTSYRKLYQFNP